MEKFYTLAVAVCLLALLGSLPEYRQGGSVFDLKGENWSVEMDPSSLYATGRLTNSSSFPLSLGVEGLGSVANLRVKASRASWDLPAA
jgi:hypothetical protein